MSNVTPLRTTEPLRPRDYSRPQLALIRRTVAADTTDDEFDMFIEVCRRVGLDPFRRQIYCLVYNKGSKDKRRVVFVTGIDGFRGVAARNRDYRPDDEEPQIVYDEALRGPNNPLGIVKATVKAYKLGPDGWHPVVGVAHWDEFAPLSERWEYSEEKGQRVPTGEYELDRKGNWAKMGRVMICKCAEAQALRKGWPEDLSGVYAPEELDQMAIDSSASEAIKQHAQEQRMLRIGAKDAVPILWAAGQPIEPVPVGQFYDRVMAFMRKSESPTEIDNWMAANQLGMREFWANQTSDGLALKKEIEERRAALEAQA